jgi:site-specific DNA-cytosine methylase
MLWFTKGRRAQSDTDYETWIEGGVMPTLNSFDNGDVRTTIIIFHPHYHDGARIQGDTMNTLTSRMGTGGNNVSIVATIPIQDGRDMEKKQNGLGVGGENDPSYTLDRTGGQSVATFPIQGTIIGRSDTAGPQGKGFGDESDPMYTLDSVSGHGVATQSNIRRLTPTECERLQGFPDGWTDEQTDSHRYKQMGNAVTVNVAEWIFNRVSDTIGL